MPSTTIAYDNAAGLVGNQAYSGDLGMDFTVNTQITIYDLGVFDNGAAIPAGVTLTVELYNDETEQLVSSPLSITSSTVGTQNGSSLFVALATPITLAAGVTYSIVASGYGAAEEDYNQGTNPTSPNTTNSDDGAISFVGTGRYGSAGAFPTNVDTGPANRYAAGTFEYATGVAQDFTVSSEALLNADLTLIDSGGADAAIDTAYTITLTAGFTLSSNITGVNLLGGSSLTIDGGGATINGQNANRGFFADAGALTLNNLTLSNMLAQGGAGGYTGSNGTSHVGGGGGAGLGGALFVGSNASVTLNGVYFSGDAAKGGAGGAGTSGYGRGAGGGLGTSGGGSGFFGVSASGGGSGVSGVGRYGGGAAAFYDNGSGANGGFGGGGAADTGSRTAATSGGNGGFGGGGGAGQQYQGNSATGGTGGFGAGSGGVATTTPFEGAGGGGGLGAGADIFVVQGGTLVINAGTVAQGTVTGGAGGTGGGTAENGGAGSAFGGGIFLQGTQSISFAPSAGQTVTVSGAIADQSGSGGTGTNAAAGTIVVDGAGTVMLSADNTFVGGSTIEGGGTLDLTTVGAGGGGGITFGAGTPSELEIQNAALASHHLANTVTVSGADVIDLPGLSFVTNSTSAVVNNGTLSVANSSVTDTIPLSGFANGTTLVVRQDSGTGTELTGAVAVGSEAALNTVLAEISSGGDLAAANDTYAIDITQGFTLNTAITPINLLSGSSLTINGGGFTLNGQNANQGFFAYAGTIAIDNLTLANMQVQGSAGGAGVLGGGGGGAGLGGGLFVKTGADVALNGVLFTGDSAVGGAGGSARDNAGYSDGGGGGMFGNGSPNSGSSGGAGGNGGSGGGGGSINGGAGGSGGFGGGGGGAGVVQFDGRLYSGSGGSGGFGGGGGGALRANGAGNGGNGGFGGGGGAQGGASVFGGGSGLLIAGVALGGGGGLGAGGAIFVEQGGTLAIGAGSITGGSVGGGGGAGGSGGGQGLGSGIFIQGSQSILLNPASGQTLTIGNTIADSAAAGGGYGGPGSLTINGAGTVSLTATNSFTGGVAVQAGDLLLGANDAAGNGGNASIAAGATLDMGGFNQSIGDLSGAGIVALSGMLTATEVDSTTFSGSLSGGGTLIKQGDGTLTLSVTNNGFTGGATLQAGELSLGASHAAGSGAITFIPGSDATLQLGAAALTADSFGNTIDGLGLGATIDLTGLTFVSGATASIAGGILTVTSGAVSDMLTVAGVPDGTRYVTQQDGGIGTEFTQLCFCHGTRIATPSGEVGVDELRVGDVVTTASGAVRPITWIGAGGVLATRGRRTAATPVIVRKGALSDNVPARDLHVTKGHSLLIDEVLIPVEYLVNHRSIVWDDRAQEVWLYHVELATHDVLLADGAPAESYRDDGNRWLFANANNSWDHAPQLPCAPVLTGGAIVDAAWRRLLDRAGPRPGVPLTDEPDLHLMVDGQRLDAAMRCDGTHVFRLRNRPGVVHVVSRAGIPQELGLARDSRMLGVALRRIALSQGSRLRTLDAEDTVPTDGFHPFEAVNGFLWTDGDAAVPSSLFDGFSGPLTIELQVGATTRYPVNSAAQAAA